MKKFLLSSLLVTSIFAFAYTQTDVSNAQFLADQGVIVKQSTAAGYRLDDTITRAEVVGIALKIKWTTPPNNYRCKWYFSDVRNNDWICRAVEIAADQGLVSRKNKTFRPQDKITNAEALAIILNAGWISITKNIGISEDFKYINSDQKIAEGWQADVAETARIKKILQMNSFANQQTGGITFYVWDFNYSANRAELFNVTTSMVRIYLADRFILNTDEESYTEKFLADVAILSAYYSWLAHGEFPSAYNIRLPREVSLEVFIWWYSWVSEIKFREDTLKDLWNSTYEFLVDMTENGVKSTYKVKSKVDLVNFKINNISSVKQ